MTIERINKSDLSASQKEIAEIAFKEAEKSNLNNEIDNFPELFVGLLGAESSFGVNNVSPTGPKGPFQFARATAIEQGLVVEDDVDDRFDPVKSAKAAVNYLEQLHSRFGNAEDTFTAYNFGPGALSQFKRGERDITPEARNYYGSVLSNRDRLFSDSSRPSVIAEPEQVAIQEQPESAEISQNVLMPQAQADSTEPTELTFSDKANERIDSLLSRDAFIKFEDDEKIFESIVRGIVDSELKAAKTPEERIEAQINSLEFVRSINQSNIRTLKQFGRRGGGPNERSAINSFFRGLGAEFSASFAESAAGLLGLAGADETASSARVIADKQREFFEPDGSLASDIGSAVGNILSFIVPGGALKVAGKGGRLISGTAATQGIGYSSSDFRRDYESVVKASGKDIDEDTADAAELFGAVIGGVTEIAAPIMILRRLGGEAVDTIVKQTVKESAVEGGGAAIGDLARNFVAADILKYDENREVFTPGALVENLQQGGIEALAGGAVSIIANVFNRRSVAPSTQQSDSIPEQDVTTGESIVDSEVNSRIDGLLNQLPDNLSERIRNIDPDVAVNTTKQRIIDQNNEEINRIEGQDTISDAETNLIDSLNAQNQALLNNDFESNVLLDEQKAELAQAQDVNAFNQLLDDIAQTADPQTAQILRDIKREKTLLAQPEFVEPTVTRQRFPRRRFGERLSNDKRIPDSVRELLRENEYEPITNQDTIDQVRDRIRNNGIERSAFDVTDPQAPITFAQRVAMAEVVIDETSRLSAEAKKINDQTSQGDLNEFIGDFVERVDAFGTELGRGVQAFAIWNRLSEAGLLRAAQSKLTRTRDKLAKKNTTASKARLNKLPEKIPSDIASELKRIAGDIRTLEESGKANDINRLILELEIQEQLSRLDPPSFLTKLRSGQTIAMLLNPKTQIRNVGGNALFFGAKTLSDFIATGLDSGVSIVTGRRTTKNAKKATFEKLKGFSEPSNIISEGKELQKILGRPTDKKSLRRAGRHALRAYGRVLSSGRIDTDDVREINGTVFTNSALKLAENTLTTLMSTPDIVAFNAEYRSSLSRQMSAANTQIPTKEMIDIANRDGMKAIFQDNNFLSRAAVKVKRGLNLGLEFGAGDLILKFTKVPANLIARGVEFSPLGFLSTFVPRIMDGKWVTDPEFKQKDFVEDFSKATVGTGIFATGYYLAKLGIITNEDERDDDVRAINKEQGITGFQINASALKRAILTGNWHTPQEQQQHDVMGSYDWAQPLSLAIAMGVDAAQKEGKNFDNTALSAIGAGIRTIEQQPLLKGLVEFFESTGRAFRTAEREGASALGNILVDTAARIPITFTPTLLNQVRQLTDSQLRETVTDNNLRTQLNRIVNRIPILSETLPAKRSVITGDPLHYENATALNVFLNPAITRELKKDSLIEELKLLRETTGEAGHFPRRIGTGSIRITNPEGKQESIKLTNEQRVRMQELTSKMTYSHFTDIVRNNKAVTFKGRGIEFNALSDAAKTSYMSGFIRDAFTAVKMNELNHSPKSTSKRAKQIFALLKETN